jgi:DNA sulfur modification protein DndB
MFTDLNKHAVKTSNSIAELYDSRDPLAVVTRNVISKIKFLNAFTDKEKDILGKYSSNLFTLSTFYNANKRIIRSVPITSEIEAFLLRYWKLVCQNVLPWKDLSNRDISKVDLRENYIVTQSVIIQVLGRLGNFFFSNPEYVMEQNLQKLQDVDWKRDCEDWALRTIRANGRMINNEEAITLTCNVLKKHLSLPLDEFEQGKENAFLDRK